MTSQVKTTRFWFSWILSSILVYPLILAFLLVFSFIWFPMMETFMPDTMGYTYSTTYEDVFILLTVSLIGGVVGLAVGILQASAVKRHFHIELKHWRRASVVGGMIGAPVMVFSLFGFHEYMNMAYWSLMESGQFSTLNTLTSILPMTMYVTVMSIVQLIVLRRYVRNAWLWILANAVAGFAFSMFVTVAFDPGFGDWLLAAIVQGAVTGFAMLWLLHQLSRETETEEKSGYAYQHVPIESDDATDPSIWDDAI